MKKFLLACAAIAVVGLCSAPASAQETIKAPGSTITRTEVQSSPTQRSGLLRRFGDRRDRGVVTTEPPVATTKSETTKVETTTPVTPPTTTTTTAQVSEPRSGLRGRLRGRFGR